MKNGFKKTLAQMVKTVAEMVNLVYQGFIENEAHYLDRALNKEVILDNLEKQVMADIVAFSKDMNKQAQQEAVLCGQIAQNIERMGDEVRSLIERIEIKIAEKLLFSEIGVKQYEEVFKRMSESVKLTADFLSQGDTGALEAILKNGNSIKSLIESYRKEHMERLTKGICEPRAANMYFDMLDFTGNIARHCTNIARINKE
ncbi:MAG: hypothetical protein JW946_00165 [Candidatus Omnitrophica bacterium]|nr:hypothetical protein [Candidatus Omnitrophota bacterium]